MAGTTVLFTLFYLVIIVCVGLYLLILIMRFVKAQQQMARALTDIAKKIGTHDGPGNDG